MIDTLAVIGLGLIGGSVALAARKRGICSRIVGADLDPEQCRQAKQLGVIDQGLSAEDAVKDAQIVVVAVPVGMMQPLFRSIAGHLPRQALLTDVGSTKSSVVEAARTAFGEVPAGFVPAHPVAGGERSGVAAASADLFEDHKVILTPVPGNTPEFVACATAFWRGLGGQVVEMEPLHHDAVLAATSHLPHLLAYTLVSTLASLESESEIFEFAAGGFRDFTRIASSNPRMWRDICLANRTEIQTVLDRFRTEMEKVQRALQGGDGDALLEIFSYAKTERDRFISRSTQG